ncbi:hypothetical protein P886_2589 [Alteromonadaceae bacterium 2753L.S.0a.02]|nr:hypothetical protein P886_2589 [Alteromonadaceae bacterium 2753L.S.0a.02]
MWKLFSFPKARHKNKNTASRSTAASSPSTFNDGDYRAVKILYSRQACDEVKALQDNVYLCGEAPWLPLSGCTSKSECRCRYLRLSDRRTYNRRDSDNGLPGALVSSERRRLGDRRRSSLRIGVLQ